MTAYEPLVRIATEPDALEAFYRDHIEAIQRFVARRISDPHLAADLTADVFLAALDGAHTFDPSRGPVIAWLYGVGRNAIAAEARRRARELHTARRIEGRRLLDGPGQLRIEERLDAERESRRLYRAMAEPPAGGTRRVRSPTSSRPSPASRATTRVVSTGTRPT